MASTGRCKCNRVGVRCTALCKCEDGVVINEGVNNGGVNNECANNEGVSNGGVNNEGGDNQ